MSIENFKPEIWSAAYLANFRKGLVARSIVTSEYEGEISAQGDTVHIVSPVDADGDVTTYNPSGAGITWGNVTSTTQALTIDTAEYFATKVDDVDRAQAMPNVLNAAVQGRAYRMAKSIDSKIMALADGHTGAGAVSLNLSAADSSTWESVADALSVASENLDSADVMGSRFVVASPRLTRAIRESGDFTPATELGDDVVRQGFLGQIYGFSVVPSNNVATSGDGSATDLVEHLFYGVVGSVALAVQLADLEAVRLQDYFADGVRGLQLYGYKIIRPTGLGVINATTVDVA